MELGNFFFGGGGVAKYFFQGRNVHQEVGVLLTLHPSFLFCPFLSFLGLSRFFRDLSGDCRGFS